MEKRISFFEFQSVKAVAKAIDPHLRNLASLEKEVVALKKEYEEKEAKLKTELEKKGAALKEKYDACMVQINALEAGVLQVTGFHVNDLVKKIIEPTGKNDKAGKPIKVTKYLPTDIVTYDESTKEFVITSEEDNPEPPTTESAGSDFDTDKENTSVNEEAPVDSNEEGFPPVDWE